MAGKPGRPCWLPSDSDREKIQMMAALGIPQEKIAKIFKVAEKTLRRHCAVELNTGDALTNSEVGRFLFNAATGKETVVNKDGTIEIRHIGVTSATITAAIFWMKTRAHWKEMMLHGGNGPEKRQRPRERAPDRSLRIRQASLSSPNTSPTLWPISPI